MLYLFLYLKYKKACELNRDDLKAVIIPWGKCDCAQHKNPALFGFFRMCRIFWHLAQCGRIFCSKRNLGAFFDFFSKIFCKKLHVEK